MSEAMFEDHEMVKRGVVEARSYQAKIAASCLRGNTLVCLPTGLGKTVIAALVAAERLKRYPGKKVVMLSPTRPLVLQHLETFRRILKLPPEELDAVTGYVPPSEREAAWRRRVIFSTPQVLSNDILASRVNLEDVSLMIFDEAHRGVGDYAYTFIAERYASTTDPLILGLTASPGCSRQDIEATMRNLYIRYVEARTAASRDVKPYLSGIRVEWVRVPLPDKFLQVKKLL
ncbi:MAG: DEAD/DEAH box helicase, partial [Candidatus Bathyarchaeia archaeon]